MTYRKDIKDELSNKGIFSKERKTGYIYYDKGYYVTKELINNIVNMIDIVHYEKMTTNFGNLFGITKATVRNSCIQGKFIYLEKGYYNKKDFIDYLLQK